MAERTRWNCQTLTSAAITQTKLSMKPIAAMPATIRLAPRATGWAVRGMGSSAPGDTRDRA